MNFAVKEKGLEDQLLGFVVCIEQPKLEEDKNSLVITVANNKRRLVELENQILSLLKTASGSLLDDEDLINTLQASKHTSEAVTEDLRISEETEKQIDAARESYRPAASRAAILFFVLNDLASIDPMYQFSLDSYFQLFRLSIDKSRKPKGTLDVKERVRTLNSYHTDAVYKYTCRGLFEKHKLLLSFQMCVKKMASEGKINNDEYLFLLRGGISHSRSKAANPSPDWISDNLWDQILTLDGYTGAFKNLVTSLEQNYRAWKQWAHSEHPETTPLPGEWQSTIDDLQRMVLLRVFRPDRIVHSARKFIAKNLGPTFIEPPPMDLALVFADSTPLSPIIFVLSPGADPSTMLRQLATQNNIQVEEISLGQGQEGPACRLLSAGISKGFWVFFANCHLSISWMPELETLIEAYCTGSTPPHPNFRLWLSSDPHPKFPISILQRGVKVTTEPPRGLRANLLRLYTGIKQERFLQVSRPSKYRRLVLSLCWFHSVLLERRKFGSLGWNIGYGFNDSDFSVCESILRLYLDEHETPWEALKYLIAEANYGGRVTDDRDRRLLNVYVDQFFNEAVLTEKNFKFSVLDTYYIPDDNQDVFAYLKNLPTGSDHPEAFGQHPNADINAQMTETSTLLQALLSLQPRTVGGGVQSQEETSLNLIDQLMEQIPTHVPTDTSQVMSLGDGNVPLRTVLIQEIARYNVFLEKIRSLLINLQKGIKGLVVISPALEQIYASIFAGTVPESWHSAYPSLKSLASWVKDLCQRIDQMAQWSNQGSLKVFWLGGFTFPSGLLTALLQCTARRNNIAIDDLSWEFIPMSGDESTLSAAPKEGAYISGMFLEGARWDMNTMTLADALPMELEAKMPVIHFKPVDSRRGRSSKSLYSCPLYIYPVRTGTRERPSFIINVDLKCGAKDSNYWAKRGTALLLSLVT